jgi:hypothetical protein
MTPLQEEVVRWIKTLPGTWTNPQWDSLSHTREQALCKLVAAGLVEARVKATATMEGVDNPVILVCRATGNFVEQLRVLVLTHDEAWVDGDGRLKARSTFVYDFLEVRLTSEGELAKRDIQSGDGFGIVFVTGYGSDGRGALAPAHVSIEVDSLGGGKTPDIDWGEPSWQELPESRAILDLLRTLKPQFTSFSEELTDAQWTAFRALTEKGAVEGILRMAFTHVEGDDRVEFYRLKGDYVSAMPTGGTIRADAPINVQIVRARLTGTGERWAGFLKGETIKPREVRGAVLNMLHKAPEVAGYVEVTDMPAIQGVARRLLANEVEAHSQRAIEIIFATGQKMERLPSSYQGREEEDMRDSLITALAAQFHSVTGETLNHKGKTDILISHEGTEILVGECKVWSGIDGYFKAISQAVGNLVWRDRAVLIMFVRNKDFSRVLEQVQNKTSDHPLCVRRDGMVCPGWYRFGFRLPQSESCEVRLDVLCFFFPD